MQVHLTLGELKALVAVLESQQAGCDAKVREELLDKVSVRDLRFSSDELDFLSDMVVRYQDALRARPGAGNDNAIPPETLDHLRDKITEACAMA